VAHELLVRRLEARGWWPVDSGEPRHELGFVFRPRTSGMRTVRSLVTVVRQGERARSLAEELDAYGKPPSSSYPSRSRCSYDVSA
jgi:hypothetical protein